MHGGGVKEQHTGTSRSRWRGVQSAVHHFERIKKMAKIEIKELPLSQITPTLDNPRVFVKNDPKMQELTDSIAAQGVVCPVLVRPSGKGFELRAGERRYRAAKAAGLKTIPAVIKEMTDEEAFDVTMTENMARVDLTPLEEARGIHSYIAHGKTIAEVAETLGRSTKYIAQRAQIVHLSRKWMKCLTGEGKHDISGWSVPMLTAIARLPEHVQDSVFKSMTEGYVMDLVRYSGVEEVNRKLADCLLSLKLAPFPTDKGYAGCHACAECKARSSYSPDLFDKDSGDGDDDRCLDRGCWVSKEKFLINEFYEKAKEKHGDSLLLCSTNYHIHTNDENKLDELFGDSRVMNACNYYKVKKSEKGARPALVVHGDTSFLKVIYIAKGSSAGQSGSGTASGGGGKTIEEKIEQNHKLRRRLMVAYLIGALDAITGDVITEKKLLVLTIAFGLPYSKTSGYTWADDWAKINDWMTTADGDFSDLVSAQLEPHVFEMIKSRLQAYLDEPYWGEAKAIAALFEVDLAPLAEKAAGAKPYPKSWKIERDGWAAGEGWA